MKVFTHSAQNMATPAGRDVFFGPTADRFFADIERVYNDGERYKLHYATAREMYNIALAAAAGCPGDPNDYRDYAIPPPANRHFFCNRPYRLIRFDRQAMDADIEVLSNEVPVQILARDYHARETLILETNGEWGIASRTDAELRATQDTPLVVEDHTPSRFYRFLQWRAKNHATLRFH